MFHIKSIIPKVINKINLKEETEKTGLLKNKIESIKKNTPDKEVFLNAKKNKLKNKRR